MMAAEELVNLKYFHFYPAIDLSLYSMKINSLLTVLATFLLSCVCLFYAIEINIPSSLAPLTARIDQLENSLRILQTKNVSVNGGNDKVGGQLNQIQQIITAIAGKNINSGPALPSAEHRGIANFALNIAYDIKIDGSPILGKKNAPVTIAAFMDLQCPYCAEVFPIIREVINSYPDKVNFVLKNYPIYVHPNAVPAAKLALAAQLQKKYYEMAGLILQNSGDTSEDKIKEYAQELGLNYRKLIRDYKNKDAQWQKRLDKDNALALQLRVAGTPTIFVNGRFSKSRDMAHFRAEIDTILATNKI